MPTPSQLVNQANNSVLDPNNVVMGISRATYCHVQKGHMVLGMELLLDLGHRTIFLDPLWLGFEKIIT